MERQNFLKRSSDGESSGSSQRQRMEGHASGGFASGEAGKRSTLFRPIVQSQEQHERHENTSLEMPASQQIGTGDLPGDRGQLEEQDKYNQNQTALKQLLKDLEQKVTSLDQQRAKRQQRAAPSEGPVSTNHDGHHQQDIRPLADQQVQGEVSAWPERLSQTSSTNTLESIELCLLLEENEQFDEQNLDHLKSYEELAELFNDHHPLQAGPSQQWELEPSWPIGSSLDEDCSHFAHFSQSGQALAPYLVHSSTDDPFQISMRPLDTPARNEQSMLQYQQEEVFDINDYLVDCPLDADHGSSQRDLLEAHRPAGSTPDKKTETEREHQQEKYTQKKTKIISLVYSSEHNKLIKEGKYIPEKTKRIKEIKKTKTIPLVYSNKDNMLIKGGQ